MFRAELLKLTTTAAAKVAVGVGVIGLLLTQLTLVTLLPALASGAIGPGPEALGGDVPAFTLESASAQLAALNPLGSTSGGGSIGIAVIAILILGVLAGTMDYRFGGIVPTALAEPRRGRILLAKVGSTAVVGLIVGAVFAVVSVVALLVSLPIAGVEIAASPAEIAGVLARGVITVALLTLLGLAVGLLARSQLVGVIVIISVLLLEPIAQGVVQLVTGTLPIWAQLMPVSLGQATISPGSDGALAPLVAGLALAALTGAVLLAAGAALRSRDI
jgi:ABC-2 type transport system permease protein